MDELKKHQPSLSVEDQIENLKSLGLCIDDEEYARRILNDISYFRLIKAFSLGLKPKNGMYNAGVTFDQIVDLYDFNAAFRRLTFSEIERIEVRLRCRLANYISSKYGVFGYERDDIFVDPEHLETLRKDIEDELNRNSKAPFVKNFQKNYEEGKLPFYALVEVFSFGTLSKFYKNLNNKDKKAIAKTFGIGYTYFQSWIESIAYVRNVCAHYGRLYNVRLTKTPQLYDDYSDVGIKNYKVFGVLLCMKHTLNDAKWNGYVGELENTIKLYGCVDISLMGFPDNWKEKLLCTLD